MVAVVWYSLVGGHITDEEVEREVQAKLDAKEKRGKFFGLIPKRSES